MPRSKHKPAKRRRTRAPNPFSLDQLFSGPYAQPSHSVLYHYTTWKGAAGILSSQRFWATAHNCTNDEAELTSADDIIVEVASQLRGDVPNPAVSLLDRFISDYPGTRLSEVAQIYLTCFTLAGDEEKQWVSYGDNGRGVCLGVRVLNEEPAVDRRWTVATMQVDYSEASWRQGVRRNFERVCSIVAEVSNLEEYLHHGVSALGGIAAAHALTAKHAEWQSEQEIRRIVLGREGKRIEPLERLRQGKKIRYLEVPVRRGSRRIALAEVVIGSNQDMELGRTRLAQLLKNARYSIGEKEYPEIIGSSISPTIS